MTYFIRVDVLLVQCVTSSVSEMSPVLASEGCDHIKRGGSASDPPGASLQEEGGQGESGQPGIRPRETRRTQKQESRQIPEKGQRQTRPQTKGWLAGCSEQMLVVIKTSLHICLTVLTVSMMQSEKLRSNYSCKGSNINNPTIIQTLHSDSVSV